MTASETISLATQIPSYHELAEWGRFWSETESVLLNFLAHLQRLQLELVGVFAQLARDRFGISASAFQCLASALPEPQGSGPRLAQACGFRRPQSLRRAILEAHYGGIDGVLALGDRLVSRGWTVRSASGTWTAASSPAATMKLTAVAEEAFRCSP